ncbi:hypothetical protein OHT20_25480 [Streptomyces caniferus]|uniref:hypothetical protein n=1 Tax=Streptomyces caniferus TaxID=285557 RepID=UPI002E2C4DBE|nr:hypothetical protein [Streptomyces caniferus]
MPQSMALAKGARITGGVFCLLFFLFTAYWLAVDLGEFGLDGLWESWTFQHRAGTDQVTAPFHLGLAALQLAAVFAAFAGQRVAGGLLAVATTLTFATALQAVISTGTHTSDNRWFLHAENATPTFDGVFVSSMGLLLMALPAGLVLLAGMRSWPRRTPSDPPMRPARTAGVVAGLVLGAMVLCNLAWQVYMLVQGGTGSFTMFYLGKGILSSLLSMAPGWSAVFFLVLTAVAALSSLMRGPAARGLAFGLAIVALPGAVVTVIGLAGNGSLFTLAGATPGLTLIGDVGLLLDLVGSAALLALMGRGEPVAPAWFPPAPSPQFAAPGFVPQAPQPGPHVPPAGPQAPPSWQPPVGPVPPVSGPPMPPAGAPPMPPGTPPAPQGGFGPPRY